MGEAGAEAEAKDRQGERHDIRPDTDGSSEPGRSDERGRTDPSPESDEGRSDEKAVKTAVADSSATQLPDRITGLGGKSYHASTVPGGTVPARIVGLDGGACRCSDPNT
jgi:hypothetical protein